MDFCFSSRGSGVNLVYTAPPSSSYGKVVKCLVRFWGKDRLVCIIMLLDEDEACEKRRLLHMCYTSFMPMLVLACVVQKGSVTTQLYPERGLRVEHDIFETTLCNGANLNNTKLGQTFSMTFSS